MPRPARMHRIRSRAALRPTDYPESDRLPARYHEPQKLDNYLPSVAALQSRDEFPRCRVEPDEDSMKVASSASRRFYHFGPAGQLAADQALPPEMHWPSLQFHAQRFRNERAAQTPQAVVVLLPERYPKLSYSCQSWDCAGPNSRCYDIWGSEY